jgi:predicted amidohydrolase
VILHLRTFDVGARFESPAALADAIAARVESSWAAGADIVALPEFLWMTLEPFAGRDPLRDVAALFWNSLWPAMIERLGKDGKFTLLGSVPMLMPDGTLRNRAPILSDGRPLHQDKLNLTPWERDFSAGETLHIIPFRGLRVAVAVCLDVEVPELATTLRGLDLDLLLVPSATESILGVERIGRCASARAVELGCLVGVCHLTGSMRSEWIDTNIGRTGFYAPSQSPFLDTPRTIESPVLDAGETCSAFSLHAGALGEIRRLREETNPALLTAPAPKAELL